MCMAYFKSMIYYFTLDYYNCILCDFYSEVTMMINNFYSLMYVLSFIILDINECARDHGCHHLCNNTDGSFHCYCNPGYILHSNGTTCIGY